MGGPVNLSSRFRRAVISNATREGGSTAKGRVEATVRGEGQGIDHPIKKAVFQLRWDQQRPLVLKMLWPRRSESAVPEAEERGRNALVIGSGDDEIESDVTLWRSDRRQQRGDGDRPLKKEEKRPGEVVEKQGGLTLGRRLGAINNDGYGSRELVIISPKAPE
ncbi:hypothetical protein B296_00042914 [Ensete ventricosum]|uniref:Uncharacterized protein n=1 Tax=Ensete ventricosum TaxID=4639 RepID=A0A426YTR5_ENSVE|nr:hypothetical protein B296_00042914 [Ensete ventricosum]